MNLKKPTSAAPEAAPTYHCSDLASWDYEGSSLAVIGHPIEHSVSPQMHNAALQCMAQTQSMFADWRYVKFDIHPDDLEEALGLMHQHRFRGINLTIPHKVDALEMVAQIDEHARAMGAVNTLRYAGDIGFMGHNTDGWGMATAIDRTLGSKLEGQTIVLLGAGGAARAAAVQCIVNGCAQLWVGNRNQERLSCLMDVIEPLAKSGQQLMRFDLNELPRDLPQRALIINATSLGLKPEDKPPLDLQQMDRACQVYDMIYHHETTLLKSARALGMACADGLSMLVWQGVRALEIWSGAAVPAQTMMHAACHAMKIEGRDV